MAIAIIQHRVAGRPPCSATRPTVQKQTGEWPRKAVLGDVAAPLIAPVAPPIAAPRPIGPPAIAAIAAPAPAPSAPVLSARQPGVTPHPASTSDAARSAASLAEPSMIRRPPAT